MSSAVFAHLLLNHRDDFCNPEVGLVDFYAIDLCSFRKRRG